MRPRGFSLLEVVVSVTFFTCLAMAAGLAMSTSVKVWSRASGRDEVQRRLIKAQTVLRRDLLTGRLSPETLQIAPDGKAVAFLTPVHPESEELVFKSDGTPFMMRTLVYYLVTPHPHEPYCPHKMLVRRRLDRGEPTPPEEESLEKDWQTWLQRPWQSATDRIVANQMFSLEVREKPPYVEVELAATSEQEARQQRVAIGHVDLSRLPCTVQQSCRVLPQN